MTASEPRLPDDFSDVEEISRDSGRLRVTLEIAIAVCILIGIYYLFAPANELDLPPLPQQEIDPIIRAQIDASREQPATPVQTAQTALASPAESVTREANADRLPDGEAAREIIAALRGGGDARTLPQIDRLAEDYQRQGRVTDAYLLWFFAARQGDGEAAFALGDLHDPNHFEPGNSLLSAADANQAYKWYQVAAGQSIPRANERLQALRNSLEAQAKAGDMAARRLLLNWQ